MALSDGSVYGQRWGSQVDTRAITETADRDSGRASRLVHPQQVASYLAKYLTKQTEDFGLDAQVKSSGHARMSGASQQALRIIETAEWLAAEADGYSRPLSNLATLGYRGHPITKSRAYSVTFGQLRRVRRMFRQNTAALDPEADIRKILESTRASPRASSLCRRGVRRPGLPHLDQAAAAVTAAMLARSR